MKEYTQLTEGERNQIYALNKQGLTQSEIAQAMSRDKSTICRELNRNRGGRGYRPIQAHRLAGERRAKASSRTKMTESVTAHIEARLRLQWSPEQISETMFEEVSVKLSHERIYQHIYADRKQGGTLHTNLRQGRPRRRKRCNPSPDRNRRGQIPNRRDISQRGELTESRLIFGDWEIDTIIGRHHQGAVVTLVERKSRYTLLAGVERRTAANVETETIRLLKPFGKSNLTITADNGKEFANHESIAEALGIDFYFARPYHSWERGTNENTNGLIRQYLPKDQPLDQIEVARQNLIMDRLNHRPRKVLGYRTPAEVLASNLN